jgi:hypothetical protein
MIKAANISHVVRTRSRSRLEDVLKESYVRRSKQQILAVNQQLAALIEVSLITL